MKIDTSSYYPQSPLGDDDDNIIEEHRDFLPGSRPPREDSAEDPAEREIISKPEEKSAKSDDTDPDLPPTDTEVVADGISTFLSWALVPLLMPVYGILLAFHLSILHFAPMQTKVVLTAIVAGLNVLIPAMIVYLLKCFGFVKDIGLNGQKERLIPYIITILCMGGTSLYLFTKSAPSWLVMFYAGGVAGGLINMLVNFRWKISAHSAGIAGVVALLIRIMHSSVPQPGVVVWLMVAIGLSGLLGSARVWLGRHTVWQVLAGYVVGFCSVFFLTMINL